MPITTILFDLDGTLLPMDQDAFVKAYFKGLAAKVAPRGYDPQQLIGAVWKGTEAMVRNDGKRTNEEVFWDCFSQLCGKDARVDEPYFREYYETDFQQVRQVCGYAPEAGEAVRKIKGMGFRVALATNPLFPAIATESRIRWAGLQPGDFALYTTYETSRYCKPNLDYYREVLAKLDCTPEECLMVGNDVSEDMITGEMGMQVFLLTPCLINKANADISVYPNGGFDDLLRFVETLK